nr:DUF3953 domain-containing protein [Lysinibacillus timonensis]
MKAIKIVIAFIIIAISVYGLITKDFSYSAMSSLLLGIYFAILGFDEYRTKGKNGWGMIYLLVSLFILVMALFSF